MSLFYIIKYLAEFNYNLLFFVFTNINNILLVIIYAFFFILIKGSFALYLFDAFLFLFSLFTINNKYLNFIIGSFLFLCFIFHVFFFIYYVHTINYSIFILDALVVWFLLLIYSFNLSNKFFFNFLFFISVFILSVIYLSFDSIAFAGEPGKPICIDGEDKVDLSCYGKGATLHTAYYEIPHFHHLADTTPKDLFVVPTANFARYQNLFVLDPRSSSFLPVNVLAERFENHQGIIIVLARHSETFELCWYYLVGDGHSRMKEYLVDDYTAGIIDNNFGNMKLGKWSNMQSLDKNYPTMRVNTGDACIIDIQGNVHEVWEFKLKKYLSMSEYRHSMFGKYHGMLGLVFFEKDQGFRAFDIERRHTDYFVKQMLPSIREASQERIAYLKRCGDVLSFSNNCHKTAMNTINYILKKFAK